MIEHGNPTDYVTFGAIEDTETTEHRSILVWDDGDSDCGMRVLSHDERLPESMVSIVDGHLRPPTENAEDLWAMTRPMRLTTRCSHLTTPLHHAWRAAASRARPEAVFLVETGFPPLALVFAAHERLAATPGRNGLTLHCEITTHPRFTEAKIRIHSIAVDGDALSHSEWEILTPALTTCASLITVPDDTLFPHERAAGWSTPGGYERGMPGRTTWTYHADKRQPFCLCPGCAVARAQAAHDRRDPR